MIPREPSVLLTAVCLLATAGLTAGGATRCCRSTRYQDLLSFFQEWRSFQTPKLVDGVPDYTAGAMAAQQRELGAFRQRLAAIDPSGWPVPQQVDYYVVRAELAGLDFDHRVLKPWANNPAFYVTVFTEESDQPAREGPFASGAVELWTYQFPLSPERAAQMDSGIRAIPKLLVQAKTNLTGNGRDLWVFGAKSIRQQSADLASLAAKLTGAPAGLKADVEQGKARRRTFAAWLDSQTAVEDRAVGHRRGELRLVSEECPARPVHVARGSGADGAGARPLACPPRHGGTAQRQAAATGSGRERRRAFTAVQRRGHRVHVVSAGPRDPPRSATGWTARCAPGSEATAPAPREFFGEVDYRDPEVMRTHGYHWFDKGFLAHEPHLQPDPPRERSSTTSSTPAPRGTPRAGKS